MRILLIYPPISRLERYSSEIGSAGGSQIPLGVYYIASYIRVRGHTVDVLDAEANNLTTAQVIDRVATFKPDVLGISSTTVAFHRAVEVAKEIKEHYPAIPVVLGGPHVTACAEQALEHRCFDFGVLKEGELTFLHLLETLEKNGNLEAVLGLAYRKGDEVVRNPPRPEIEDLNALPFPAFDMIPDLSLYNPPPCNYKFVPIVNIITSRGCPNRCTFCDQAIFGRKLRQRSARNVADEIELLYTKYNVREIAFVDDTFTIGTQRIRDIFQILDDRNIQIAWTCMSRVNTVDRDFLKFARDKGCWHISIGIESGNEEILRIIRKDISLGRARQVIAWCSELGIKTKGFFIIGHPGETLETIEQTIEIALEMPLDDVVVTLNTPFPGSEQLADVSQFGKLDATDWSRFNCWQSVFVPHGLDQGTLLAKHREFYRRFYLRPRIIWRYFKSFLSSSGLRRFLALLGTLPFLLKKRGSVCP